MLPSSHQTIHVVVFLMVDLYPGKMKNQRMWAMTASLVLPSITLLVMSLLQTRPEYKWVKSRSIQDDGRFLLGNHPWLESE